MFCVECGKEDQIYENGVCLNCFLKSNKFTTGPEILDLPVCTHCNSFKFKSLWTSELLTNIIIKIVRNTFKISNKLRKITITPECIEHSNEIECKIHISGFIDKTEITETHEVLIRYRKTVCDTCSKQFGGYHEAIIQVRSDDKTISKEELIQIRLLVEKQVEILKSKGNHSLFITDVSEEHGGLDFYMSDKGVSLAITKKIQEEYGGIVKQSSKNIGMKDSRQVYRMTYLLRLPNYHKGDYLKIKKDYFKILSVSHKTIKTINLSTWVKTTYDLNIIDTAKIIKDNNFEKEMILVSQTKDEVQVMDPKTYKIQIIRKPKEFDFKDEKITIIKIDEQFFIKN